MSDHLPECLLPDFDKGKWVCCCAQLRACEERVRDEHADCICNRVNAEHSVDGNLLTVWIDGVAYEPRAAALDAARDAVAAAMPNLIAARQIALDAIDALRGEA